MKLDETKIFNHDTDIFPHETEFYILKTDETDSENEYLHSKLNTYF